MPASDPVAHVRAWFPHTAHGPYLNHASTGPLSSRVKAALDAFIAERHDTNVENFYAFMPTLDATRAQIAAMLHTDVAQVAYTANASHALNVLALGLDWQPGDRIAVPGCEFPANVTPFLNLSRLGVHVDFVPHTDGTFTLDDVARTITPRTRLVSVSWVQFLSGFRCDLAALGALCRERGVLLCVDAIQGLGALEWPAPPDTLGVDFVVCSTHKWLLSTQGLGFLYCAPDLLDRLIPAIAGWLSGPVDWERFFDYRLDFHDDATRFHIGTLNHLSIAALHAALQQREDAGPAWCAARIRTLADRLARALDAHGLRRYGTPDPAHGSGIVTVHHPDPDAAYAHLNTHGVRAALRNRLLRFSPTWYNTEEEVDRAAEVLAAM